MKFSQRNKQDYTPKQAMIPMPTRPVPQNGVNPVEISEAVKKHIAGLEAMSKENDELRVALTAANGTIGVLNMRCEMLEQELKKARHDLDYHRDYSISMSASLLRVQDVIVGIMREAKHDATAQEVHDKAAERVMDKPVDDGLPNKVPSVVGQGPKET